MTIRALLLACAAASPFVVSAATTLGPGDTAPPLAVYRWIKGTPIKNFEKGKVYVVEFWATWCGPCKESIPHLTELAKKYAGKVTFAGVSVAETQSQQPGSTDISYIPTVAAFVKNEGAAMDYNVGVDGPTGSANRNWMVAAGQTGIPTAFLIGPEGKIMWIGHPMLGLDKAIDKVLDGKFDIAAEKAREGKQQSTGPSDGAVTQVLEPWVEAMQAQNWHGAVQEADKAIAAHPEMADDLIPARFEALARDDVSAANKYAASLGEAKPAHDASLVNEIAWMMIDETAPLPGMDPGVAEGLASKALTATKPETAEYAEILDTLALAQYKNGKKKDAIQNQEKAVALYKKVRPDDLDTLKEMEGRLAEFRSQRV